jgi:hypothetical protein
MYWRVKRLEPNYILRKYGVFIALAISIPMNFFLILTRPDLSKVMDTGTKTNLTQFARDVAVQLLDSSYTTYEKNTRALLAGELAPSVEQQLKEAGLLPKSAEEMQAQLQGLKQIRQVASVRIDEVVPGDPNEQSLVPVEVRGLVAVHSAQEGGPQEMPFKLQFLLGTNAQNQQPIVARLAL